MGRARYAVAGLVALLAGMTIACSGRADDWRPFESEPGRFRVSLPDRPEHEDLDVEGADGPFVVHEDVTAAPGVDYRVSYFDFPEHVEDVKPADVPRLLDATRNGSLKKVGGELSSERDIRLDGHPGREFEYRWTIEDEPPHRARARIFLVGRRMYKLLYLAEEEFFEAPDCDRFFRSFGLIEADPAAAP
jgi:hypothetical protein